MQNIITEQTTAEMDSMLNEFDASKVKMMFSKIKSLDPSKVKNKAEVYKELKKLKTDPKFKKVEAAVKQLAAMDKAGNFSFKKANTIVAAATPDEKASATSAMTFGIVLSIFIMLRATAKIVMSDIPSGVPFISAIALVAFVLMTFIAPEIPTSFVIRAFKNTTGMTTAEIIVALDKLEEQGETFWKTAEAALAWTAFIGFIFALFIAAPSIQGSAMATALVFYALAVLASVGRNIYRIGLGIQHIGESEIDFKTDYILESFYNKT